MRDDSSHLRFNGRVSILREEFLLLTGEKNSAILLNHIYYTTSIQHSFKLMIQEELCESEELSYGWIQKSASSLIRETKVCACRKRLGQHLNRLNDKGVLLIRKSQCPDNQKTKQCRLHLTRLQEGLSSFGYGLPLIPTLSRK